MTTVYRVQDGQGRGPWRPGFSLQWVEERSEEKTREMMAWADEFLKQPRPKRTNGAHMGFGCRSLEELRQWFTPAEYDRLQYHGYGAVKLDADRILAEYKTQLLFERDRPLREGAEVVMLFPYKFSP